MNEAVMVQSGKRMKKGLHPFFDKLIQFLFMI